MARAIAIGTSLDPNGEPAIVNNRFEMICWMQNLIAKLTERRGGTIEEMKRWFAETIRAVFGDCVEYGDVAAQSE